MQKVLIWLLSLSLLLSLTGCSGNADAAGPQEASSQVQNAPEESGSQNTAEQTSSQNTGAQESAPEESVVSIEADTVVLEKEPATTQIKGAEGVDIDLTVLSGNMVYAQVFQMMYSSEEFIGKVVRMRGSLSMFEDEGTGRRYFSCLIKDAMACCAQGIEFELTDDYSYPEDYPAIGDYLTVQGTFDTYVVGTVLYVTLRDAVLIQED